MVTEMKFDPLFDYSSVFKYESILPMSKGVNNNYYKSAFTYHSVNIDTDSDTDETKDENLLSSVLRKTVTILLYLFVILSFPLSVWICVKKIHALERIVLMRLGKLQAVRGPGFAVVLPIIDVWTRVDLRPQTFIVSTSQLLTADGGVIELKSDIEYQVADVIRYVMRLSKQESTLKDLGLLCLRNVISEKDQEDLEMKRELLCCSLKNELNRSALSWGLEILNVNLYSLKILKEAEPVDALGTLMIALKAATGHSSEHTAAVFPVSPDSSSQEQNSAETSNVLNPQNVDIVDVLKNTFADAERNGFSRNMSASFKFTIVGNHSKTVYCIFKNGETSVIDDFEYEMECDVSLIISEDNMNDIFNCKMSPLEAYMDGKVMVMGDWSLLRPLSKMLEKPLQV